MNGELSTGQLIALAVPLALVQIGLMAAALYDLVKRERVKGGSKLLWGIVAVVLGIIGPILYFVLGREEE